MNRRAFVSKVLYQPKPKNALELNKYANKLEPQFMESPLGLNPYSGAWGKNEAKHLLSRTMFGATRAQINAVAGMDVNTAVSTILSVQANPDPPLNNYSPALPDPQCPAGVTWVDKGFSQDPIINNQRVNSWKDWWLSLMLNQGISIHEKMVLFWHNLLATQTSTVNSAQLVYKHNKLLRDHALGNYKTLVRQVSIDPAMLIYLNGYKNQKNNPDENYARELQELFTLGKGPDSRYTEEDVKAAAKVLTGYTVDLTTETYKFVPSKHDTTSKTFSSFYNNTVITGRSGAAGENELDDLISMILANNEVAKHVVRKLYRFFVYYVISDEIEQNIITPLADTFRNSNYEILPVLEQLLKSEHFFDTYNRACVIKNPIDFVVGTVKQLSVGMPNNSNVPDYYTALRGLNQFNFLLNMDPGDPPNVAGWEAYWNSPIFHEFWINGVTLPYRNILTDVLISPNGFTTRGVTIKSDIFALTETIANAEDPNFLIEGACDLLYVLPISDKQTAYLKTILLSNQLQDHYWTDAWLDWKADKTNMTKYNTVLYRLYPFYKYLLNLAEFQLI